MTKTTIKSMSNNCVSFIAGQLNCEATKAELTRQFKANEKAIENAYNKFNRIAQEQADARRRQHAEELAEKARKLAEAEASKKKETKDEEKQTGEKEAGDKKILHIKYGRANCIQLKYGGKRVCELWVKEGKYNDTWELTDKGLNKCVNHESAREALHRFNTIKREYAAIAKEVAYEL